MKKIARATAMILHAFLLASAIYGGTAPFGPPPAFASRAVAPISSRTSRKLSFARVPLSFERNVGQTAPPVRFLSRVGGYTLFLTGTDAVMTLQRRVSDPAARLRWPQSGHVSASAPKLIAASVRLHLVGANPAPVLSGEDEQAGKSSYFIGNNPQKWRTNICNYGRVKYRNIYPGIDLVYYGTWQCLEHDFIMNPGAVASSIRLRIDGGSQGIKLDPAGNLVVRTAAGSMTLSRPTVYQQTEGKRLRVDGHFVRQRIHEFGFSVGRYDHHRPLIIDPLIYSTYLGGSGLGNDGDYIRGIAVDAAGNAYVAGLAGSADFPTTPGAFQTVTKSVAISPGNAFVTKLNASGTALVYSTYLGGSVDDIAYAIAVDAEGNAYVTGDAASPDFPITPGVFQSINKVGSGSATAFVTKLDASGTSLIYSTFLGGSTADNPYGIAVDAVGNSYLAGYTHSHDFPTTPGAFQTGITQGPNGYAAFVTKLNSTGTGLVYSTYLAGTGTPTGGDRASAIAVDSSRNAYVTGEAHSSDFPTTAGAFQTVNKAAPNENAFVTKLNVSGTGLAYSTYVGGTGIVNEANAIAVDSMGNAYVAGDTGSTDFPTTPGAFQTVNKGRDSVFVTKLNANGTGLVYSTYLGGNGGNAGDYAYAIAVDSAQEACVAGSAASPDFPISPDAFQTVNGGDNAFMTKLKANGTALVYSSFLGGDLTDQVTADAVDSAGSVYVAGLANSKNFPTTAGAFQTVNPETAYNAGSGFVTKLALGLPVPPPVLHTFTGTGWHLVSSPYTITQTFASLSITAFAYNPVAQNYVVTPTSPADTFHIGPGCWIYLRGSSLDIPGPGTPIDNTQPFSITLGQAWNLVGDPFTSAAPLANITVTDPSGITTSYATALANHVVSNLFIYNNATQGYTILGAPTDQLNTWDGAWIYSKQAGTKLVYNSGSTR